MGYFSFSYENCKAEGFFKVLHNWSPFYFILQKIGVACTKLVLENGRYSDENDNISLKLSEAGIFAFWIEPSVHIRHLAFVSFFEKSLSKTHWISPSQSCFELYQKQNSPKAFSAKPDVEKVSREFVHVVRPYSCNKYKWICHWPFEKWKEFFIGSMGSRFDMK